MVEFLPGWQQDLADCRSWEDLPQNAKGYVTALERLIGHPIQMISVGPERDAFLTKGDWA